MSGNSPILILGRPGDHGSRMKQPEQREAVVWLHDVHYGVDSCTGELFRTNRHVVRAARLVVDSAKVMVLDGHGIVLNEWDAQDVARIDWRPEPSQAGSAQEALDGKQRPMPATSAPWPGFERQRYPNHYRRWTPEEDDRLRAEHARGDSVLRMAAAHQRKQGSIRSRLAKLAIHDEVAVAAKVVA